MNNPTPTQTHTETHSCNEILQKITDIEWKKEGNEGEPPIPTPEALRLWMPPFDSRLTVDLLRFLKVQPNQTYHKDKEPTDWRAKVCHRVGLCKFQHAEDVPIQESLDTVEKPLNRDDIRPRAIADLAAIAVLGGWNNKPNLQDFKEEYGIASLEDGVVALHHLWMEVERLHPNEFKHPLAPIVRAWLDEQTSKRIDKEYDRKYPAAILKHPMGSIREIAFTETDPATLKEFATPQKTEKEGENQFLFDFPQDTPSVLPPFMPLEVAHPMGMQTTTKRGAVSHVVRVFFESLLALEPKQTHAKICFRLGDLINYLYPGYYDPDGKLNHKAFHRGNQLPYIIDALDVLHFYATVPFRDDIGDMRRWRPVVVQSSLDMSAKNDTPVYMLVDLPPDAKQGYMIIKKTHRELGKASAPQFNAYHTAAWLWDKHGTTPKGIIDPSRPIERRDAEGRLLDGQGNIILNSKGKPVNNLYDPASIKQSPREYNPAADRYPVLSDSDLLFACYPSGYKGDKSTYIKRAKENWKEMEKQGIITIKEERGGWRIMPGGEHLNLHRGVKKASTKKR